MGSKSRDAFRTISEVADWLDTQSHVLRFWESKFTQVKPVKRAGGRRYYRPADMLLLGGIKKLLHDDGLTIKGVQKLLREKGVKHVSSLSPLLDDHEEITQEIATPEISEDTTDERGTVLNFATSQPASDPTSVPDTQATPQDTPEDSPPIADLFQATSSSQNESTPEIADTPEPSSDIPPSESIPAFVQRASISPAETKPAIDTQISEPARDEVSASNTEQTPVESAVPDVALTNDADTQPVDEPKEAPESDPVQTSETPDAPDFSTSDTSVLTTLASSSGVSATNRPQAQAVLAQLRTLRDRMTQSVDA
nr:MerR family transcriptional regulator [uncultured Shimia sp.]